MEVPWIECTDWMDVTVGYKTYKVVQGHSLNNDFLGEASHWDSMIYIESNQKPIEKLNTLLHEIVHCCLKVSGVRPILEEHKLEESIVECVANMLTDTFKRNPEFMQLLNDECKV